MTWPHHPAVRRMRGRRLQRARAHLFNQDPRCVECLKTGCVTVATIRDHIVPLAEGGTDTEANTQALCQACSDRKTQREAHRGLARTRPSPKPIYTGGPPRALNS